MAENGRKQLLTVSGCEGPLLSAKPPFVRRELEQCERPLTAYSVEKLFFVDFWTFPRKRVSIKTMGYLG
jgi:hypothetical protein